MVRFSENMPISLSSTENNRLCYYIVDFYCDKKKTVVELDGSQHFEEAGQEYDRRRDDCLREQGLTILRYANSDIQDNFGSSRIVVEMLT